MPRPTRFARSPRTTGPAYRPAAPAATADDRARTARELAELRTLPEQAQYAAIDAALEGAQDAVRDRVYPELAHAVRARTRTRRAPARATTLGELFAGDEFAEVRQAVATTGRFTSPRTGRTLHVHTRPGRTPAPEDREVIAMASVARDPGKTQDYIDLVDDFLNKQAGNRSKTIQQLWEIYKTEGIVNNAINKYASLLSSGGEYSVRKARRGKQQKTKDVAQAMLDHFNRNVNGPTPVGVATAARGLKAVTEQGLRVALVEGDWMGRQVWGTHPFASDKGDATAKLPMTIQTISMEYMEAVAGLQGLGELWYWKPTGALKNLITGDTKLDDPNIKQVVKRLFDNKLAGAIKKDGRALLTPALLCHVKHRGSERDTYGESFIEPAKLGIRYLRGVTNLDLACQESVINRLLIVMVGSSDPKSPYSKADVAAARQALMQSFFDDPGPNMTIVWSGDDVQIKSVGAVDELPQTAESHRVGEGKIKVALGIPDALLSGTTADGKSAGWASLLSASGMAEHLGSAFATEWTIMGERILTENNFTDQDVLYQYRRSNLADKEAERSSVLQFYMAGIGSIRSCLLALDKDPDAEFRQRAFEKGLDPDADGTTWEQVFTPPQGLAGQGAGGIQGQGDGKTPGDGRGPAGSPGAPATAPAATPAPAPKEKKSPKENK